MSDRLQDRLSVYDSLEEVFTNKGAHQWMHRPHKQLQGRTPAQAITDGDTSAVMLIITRLAGGPRA